MRFGKLSAAVAVLLFPVVASAAPCTGAPPFTDVSALASYCTNTEWLKNRNVTLGCGGTDYCPNQAVDRGAMALFMNRLADALIMPPLRGEILFGPLTLTTAAADNAFCNGGDTARNYPRVFTMIAHVSLLGAGGPATVAVQPRYSLDGGNVYLLPNTFAQHFTADNVYTGNASVSTSFFVPAGSPVDVNVGLFSVGGSTAIASGRCHILVRGQSFSAPSSPFDSELDSNMREGS